MSKDNLSLWLSVEKTDPKHTKELKTGGRKMTAINAQYQVKNATEKFGKYGNTWGLKNIKLEYLTDLCNNQILAISRAVFYYPDGEFEIGSSILVQSWIASKSYNKVDDDFMKKLETDMTTKALSKLGFNADVFLGLYDDNRYVNDVRKEFELERLPALTDTQFEATKKGTKSQILNVVGKYRMSEQQRAELIKLANDGRE